MKRSLCFPGVDTGTPGSEVLAGMHGVEPSREKVSLAGPSCALSARAPDSLTHGEPPGSKGTEQEQESQPCPSARDAVWSENTKRPCSFPRQLTDVGDGLHFRSTVRIDFRLQRPSQEGMRCRHAGARSLAETDLDSHGSPRCLRRRSRGRWPGRGLASALPRPLGLPGRASLFTYLGPRRGSGKGNLLSRFLRRDHICSRRKRCFLGSGYGRKDVGFSEADPEGPWDLGEPRTAPRSGLGCSVHGRHARARLVSVLPGEQPWH